MAAAIAVTTGQAQESTAGARILRIDVQIEGTEGWQSGGSHEKATLSQRYYFATVLRPAEDLDSVNLQDPESVRRTQERSLAMQADVARRQPPHAGSGAAMQKQVNDAIAQAYARCKGDEKCIADAVMRANPGLMAPPPGAVPRAGAHEVRDVPEEKPVYRQWFSFDGCPGVVRVLRNDTSRGSMTDVGGPRPLAREVKVDVDRTTRDTCLPYIMTVVDEKAGKVFLPAYAFPAVPTMVVGVGSGGKLRKAVPTVPPEIEQYLTRLFKGAPLSGTKSEMLTLRKPVLVSPLGQTYSGSVKVTVKWSFLEPYKAAAALPRG